MARTQREKNLDIQGPVERAFLRPYTWAQVQSLANLLNCWITKTSNGRMHWHRLKKPQNFKTGKGWTSGSWLNTFGMLPIRLIEDAYWRDCLWCPEDSLQFASAEWPQVLSRRDEERDVYHNADENDRRKPFVESELKHIVEPITIQLLADKFQMIMHQHRDGRIYWCSKEPEECLFQNPFDENGFAQFWASEMPLLCNMPNPFIEYTWRPNA